MGNQKGIIKLKPIRRVVTASTGMRTNLKRFKNTLNIALVHICHLQTRPMPYIITMPYY
jgi:hypothetical protein